MSRAVCSCSLIALALAAPTLRATCNSWTLNPAPNNYVSANSMSVADPDGPGSRTVQLVVPNSTMGDDGSGGVGLWNGTTLTPYGPFSAGSVYSSTEYNGQLVVGGNFGGDTTVFNVVKGDGTSWAALGTSGGLTDARLGDTGIDALVVFNGNLVAGGAFSSIDGVAANSIAVWNGSAWSTLGTGFNGTVRALAVYNNDLYAAGIFTTADGQPANNIAYWHAGAWHAAGGGVAVDRSFQFGVKVNALAVYAGKLFVGGSFAAVGGTSADIDGVDTLNIAAWDGTNWTTFGTGLDDTDDFSMFASVTTLAVVSGSLYAGGFINDANGVAIDGIARWNGTSWGSVGATSLAASLATDHVQVLAIHEYQGQLVAAGFNNYADFIPFFATFTPNVSDFDGNNATNVNDIFAFLRAWFAHSATADTDTNGVVNVNDIFAFLRHWFGHC